MLGARRLLTDQTMPEQTRTVQPGPQPRTVRADHAVLSVPADWDLLPPGDPGLTRRVKKEGPSWSVEEKRGRKTFSQGVYAPRERIERLRAELEHEREDPSYRRKLDRARAKRENEQSEYEEEFFRSVHRFLGFAQRYESLADELAKAIAGHAVPVGSGTVARTKRIPIEQRAEAATIAWLRHATTGYDSMKIPRVKGMRREVRRMLAERSRSLLELYRQGEPIDEERCLLRRGLSVRR